MSDHNHDAFLRQRRNLVITSSILLVYVEAGIQLTRFNGVVISGEIHNELFLVDFMLVLIGYFMVRYFQSMQSKYQEFTHKWKTYVESKANGTVTSELFRKVNHEKHSAFGFGVKATKSEKEGVDVYVVHREDIQPYINSLDPSLFVYQGPHKDPGNQDEETTDVFRVNPRLITKFKIAGWLSISWRTSLLTEYYLPVIYSTCVIWWYMLIKLL